MTTLAGLLVGLMLYPFAVVMVAVTGPHNRFEQEEYLAAKWARRRANLENNQD
jgi:hypothetical protein